MRKDSSEDAEQSQLFELTSRKSNFSSIQQKTDNKNVKKGGIKITRYSVEQFQIKIKTKSPKSFNHFVYGDQVLRIISKIKGQETRYYVQWDDSTKNFVDKSYLYQYHRSMLEHFQIKQAFGKFVNHYQQIIEKDRVYIVID